MHFLRLKLVSLFLLLSTQLPVFAKTPEGDFAYKLEEIGKIINEGKTLEPGVIAELIAVINSPDFDVNARAITDRKKTVAFLLEVAIRCAPWPIIRRLIELGAEIGGNEFAPRSTTPLHLALAHDRTDVLANLARTFSYLLDETDETGRTALEVAHDSEDWAAYTELSDIQEQVERKNSKEKGRGLKRTKRQERMEQRKKSRSQERKDSDSDEEETDNQESLYQPWDEEEPSSQNTEDTEMVDSPSPRQDSVGSVTGNAEQNATEHAANQSIFFVSFNPLYRSAESLS